MQRAAFLLIGCLTGTVLAQTPFNQQVISSPPTGPVTSSTSGPGSLMITNSLGGTFPLSQLDAQLTTLKAEVERTLPLLSAVVSQNPNITLSRGQELANAASNFLARAFSRTNQNNALPQAGTSARPTNFAGFLRGLISTNSAGGGGVSFDPNTINQLVALQNELKPVLSTLASLNIPSVEGMTNQVPGAPSQPGGAFSPTGR